jgi:hypothetical protein
MKTATFKGATHRVQIGTLDLIESPKFFVYAIPAHYHKSTAFRSKVGVQLFWGEDSDAAWAKVLSLAPHAVRPAWVKTTAAAPA